jgi:hypothetical protein
VTEDLLDLAAASAAENTNAGRRRAVSTAYYAAFHALCGLVAAQIVGDADADADLFEGVYRSVEHRFSDNPTRFAVSSATEEIRLTLRELRERRADADYRPDFYRVTTDYVADTLGLARRLIATLATLDHETSRKLAISLAIEIKPRSRQRPIAQPKVSP